MRTWTISGVWENRASIFASRRKRSLLLRKRVSPSVVQMDTLVLTEHSRITTSLGKYSFTATGVSRYRSQAR